MPASNSQIPESSANVAPQSEGGLHAPAELGFWGKIWFWFHFAILVKLARLRFIGILVAIGVVIVKWDTLVAYYERWTRPDSAEHAGTSDFEYFCPMHPTVIREHRKEKCPICHMDLSKRKKGTGKPEALPPGIVNRVQLSPYRIVLAGIQKWQVAFVPLIKEITTVGTVEFNEKEMKHVAARVKGRIDKLYISETGQWVSRDDELASLYSPDLIITVQNLLDANRGNNKSLEDSTRDRLRQWGISAVQMNQVIGIENVIEGLQRPDQKLLDLGRQQLQKLDKTDLANALQDLLKAQRGKDEELLSAARQKLVKQGIHADQIDDILKTGKSIKHLIIRAPISGHVLKKYVKEGQYVDEGSPLYDVVDLKTVWVQAQVYEEDMSFLPTYHRPAQTEEEKARKPEVAVTTRADPTSVLKGRLAFVYPHVDQETRTVIARVELENRDHKLRPGTSATVKIKIVPKDVELLNRALDEDLGTQLMADALRVLPAGGIIPGIGLSPSLDASIRKALLDKGLVLAVPESAVIDTGSQRIVYREYLPGEFEGVSVTLGPRMVRADDVTFYPVLSGLEAGDMIVTAGSFLVDAETRLNPAAGSIYFGGSGSKSGQAANVKPSTPNDPDAKVKAALAKLSESDRKLAEAQGFCPVLKYNRLGSMGVPIKIDLNGQPVFLCCIGCEDNAKKNVAKTVQTLAELKTRGAGRPPLTAEEEKEIKAELAKLTPADRRLAEQQVICPQTDNYLGSMPGVMKIMIRGEPVFLCCKSCVRGAMADEAATLRKVLEFRARHGSKK
jgi:Cu(I)/Ag(I) efflux system membrane fusion protein